MRAISNAQIIARAMLVAPRANGDELVFTPGIVEGRDRPAWDKSTRCEGAGKLLVHNRADGKLLACPVFDGLSAAGSRLIVPLVTGKVVCLRAGEGDA